MYLDAPLLYMFSIDWLACSLFLAHISVACEQISSGKHVHINGWLMRYGTMWWTLLSITKCLGCFTWKNSLTSSLVMIFSHQSHMVFTLENLIHMLLVITLSFVKLLWPLLEAFHAFMIKITYTPPSYAKLLHWKLATSIHNLLQSIYESLSLIFLQKRHGLKRKKDEDTCSQRERQVLKIQQGVHITIQQRDMG
jgi:hypothetical protein